MGFVSICISGVLIFILWQVLIVSGTFCRTGTCNDAVNIQVDFIMTSLSMEVVDKLSDFFLAGTL